MARQCLMYYSLFVFFLVGCVIVHQNSRIIASGKNQPVQYKNATRHAEICALDQIYATHDMTTAKQVCVHHENSTIDCVYSLVTIRINNLCDL